MIRNQWYAILESNEVRRGKPVGVTRMGEKLVAWRDSQGKVAVLHDRCAHRGVALSVGEVHGDCIWCPFHGFEFDADDAGAPWCRPTAGTHRCRRRFTVQAYPTHEAPASSSSTGASRKASWRPCAGSRTCLTPSATARPATRGKRALFRVVENQLDVPHVPFIHQSTRSAGAAAP